MNYMAINWASIWAALIDKDSGWFEVSAASVLRIPCHTSNSCHGNWMLNCGSTVGLASWNRLFFFVQRLTAAFGHSDTLYNHYNVTLSALAVKWQILCFKMIYNSGFRWTCLCMWFKAHQIKYDLCFLYYCIIIQHSIIIQEYWQTPILKCKCSYMFSCVKSKFTLWNFFYKYP